MLQKVDRREWRWVLGIALGVCFLSTIPFLIAHLTEPPGLKFAGVLIAPGDNLSYLAKMEMGRRGNWLFQLPYTGADHGRVPLVYIYYLFLGHLSGWLNLPTLWMFHLMRWFNSVFLLSAVYVLIAQVSDEVSQRRMALLMVALSSGFGWVAAPLGFYLSPDIMSPESNTFLSIFDNPHFTLSQGLMICAFLLMMYFVNFSWRHTMLYILVSSVLVLIQPFAIALVFGIGGVYGLRQWWQEKRFPWAMLIQMGVAFAVSLPIFYAVWLVLNTNPLLKPWSETPMLTPPFWHYIIGYGLLWIGVMWGIYTCWKRGRDADHLLIIWIGFTLFLIYVPLSLQRRFSMGWHIPLSIIATLGLNEIVSRLKESYRWLVLRIVMLVTMMTTFAVIVLFASGSLMQNPKLYLTRDEDLALNWLRVNGRAETAILSSTDLGRFVPVFSSGRAVSGHDFETLNAKEAEAEVLTFYNDATSVNQRLEILKKHQVSYVIFGTREKGLNAQNRDCLNKGLTRLAQFGEVEIYSVQ